MTSQTKTLRPGKESPLAGSTFADRYKILRELGSGGMGVVYLAEDTRLKRPVALKFLPASLTLDPEARERFVQEAQAASRIDHPNICTIHEVDETEDGRTFIVMAYYPGESLKEKIKRGPLSVREAIDIAIQAAGGLAKAHEQGIIHRDIKPANIIVTAERVAKIVDFGLAKLSGQVALTRAGTVMGTAAYMSPEQARGEDVDRRTDIWSLGAVLYEMLTGELPFQGENEQSVIYAILNIEPRPASGINSSVPVPFDRVLARALAKNPDERYASANELLADLENLKAGAPVVAAEFKKAQETKEKSVAVINFMNISGDTAMDWLSDGIAETVTVDLKKISSLSVVSREKVLEAQKTLSGRKVSEERVIDVGRNLGVQWIVWGGFQKFANALRMTAHFTDVATGRLAGSAKADGTMDDVFKLQDEIVTRLIGALDLEVSDSELRKIKKPETVEVKAYEYYVRGRELEHQFGKEGLPRAIEYFQKAIDCDPGYALAYAGLGGMHMIKYIAGTHHEDLEKGISYLQEAIRLDPDIADPYSWLTYGYARDRRYEEAIRHGRKAVELEPENPLAHYFLGVALMLQAAIEYKIENYKLAVTHFDIDRQLQPNYGPAPMNAGWIYSLRGQYQEAEEAWRKAVAIEESGKPEITRFVGALTLMGNLCLRRGLLDQAKSWYDRSLELLEGGDHVYGDPFKSLTYCGVGTVYFCRGRYDDALREFKKAEALILRIPRSLGIGYFLIKAYLGQARAYSALGESAESKEYFEKAAHLFRTKAGFDFNWIWEGCDAQVHYDTAGYFALLDKKEEALENLRLAVRQGWRDVPALKNDALFAVFRGDASFAQMIEDLEKQPPFL